MSQQNENRTIPPTIPPVSRPEQHTAATERRAAYPYRFPKDRRRMGGKFTVEQGAERLLRFFYLERRLGQGLGSWTLTIPDFEVKLETGRHLFWHFDAAKRLRDRLFEMEYRLPQIDSYRDAELVAAELDAEIGRAHV